jgi:formamidopyrimidine-DNA glycosylase
VPELPEVESLRLSLVPALIGRSVTSLRLLRKDIAHDHNHRTPDARALLCTATIDRLERRGKQLAIVARDGRTLIVHLGMTGHLRHVPLEHPPQLSHIHAIWSLDDRSTLFFRDPRRFGGLWTLPDRATLETTLWRDLGPAALHIDARHLRDRFKERKRAIKSTLLDQSVLAGVGNIYADEALFRAGIRPTRSAGRLTPAEITLLTATIRSVLARAIERRGSTIRDYVDSSGTPGQAQLEHMVYDRGGQPCKQCDATLHRATIGQRTTVWCPTCQR